MFGKSKESKELAKVKLDKEFWEMNWYCLRKALKECVADGTITSEIYEKIIDKAADITLEQFEIIAKDQD